MKSLIIILVLCTGISHLLSSYPISPRPLRKLIIESEYIVSGHVKDIREQARKKNEFFGGSVAELVVYEILQGKISETSIFITFNPYLVCPAPPRFKKDTDVLVFLSKREKHFFVHALSYGLKTLSIAELNVFKMRISEMQKILQIEDTDRQFVETTEWLVKCAEHPVTRNDGVYELTPESNFMSYYDRTENLPFKFVISAEQKLRLKIALLSTTDNDYVDFGLVDLVYLGNEEEIFNYLLNGLRNVGEDKLWYADEYMKRLSNYKTSPTIEKFIQDYDERKYSLDKADAGKLQAIIKNFIEEIGMM
jgi:hypothetical protein